MSEPAATATPGSAGRGLLAVLVASTALGPFAMQVFLPALPAIQAGFAVSPAEAQLAFSLSTLAIAVATLVYGPLSDRIGRRPAMLGGLLVYLGGTALCALASSLWLLILGRIVQAAGGCVGMVLSRAVVRDLYPREQAAQALAWITMAMVVAPMMAPALGGLLVDLFGWRSIFLLGLLVGGAVLWASLALLRETGRPGTSTAGAGGMLAAFLLLLREPAFRGWTMQAAFSMSVFFAFLAAAPFLVVQVYGRPAVEYGLLFVLVSGAFMAGNFTAARLSARLGSERMIVLGSLGSLAGAGLALALALAGVWTPVALFLPTALGGFAQGLAMPNAQAAIVSVRPELAGTASGLAGFAQMAIAAAAAQLVGSLQTGTPVPVTLGMTVCAALALLGALLGRRAHRQNPAGRA
ncbi:MAG: multidrug effflux MFS transporter [Geminicoccaceae bacterium]|nr:multidrug effflux MFS transporter [Geminicoccaceae bacterium]